MKIGEIKELFQKAKEAKLGKKQVGKAYLVHLIHSFKAFLTSY